MRTVAAVLAVVAWFASMALAQSPSIDLTQIVTDIDGKPYKVDTKREPGLRVLVPFDTAGRSYKLDDEIVDPEEVRHAVAVLQARKAEYSVERRDADCAKCEMTLGWVLSQALAARICSLPQPGQPKNPACTPEEERLENDPVEMGARMQMAVRLRDEPTAAIGAKSLAQLRELVRGRFQQEVPGIVVRVLPMIGGAQTYPEWGKD